MGEELELGQFFIKVGDGGYVPFNGITQIDATDLEAVEPATYIPEDILSNAPLEMTFTLRQDKVLAKWRKQLMNRLGRHKRRILRKKEKDRRRRLKYNEKF